MNVCTSRHRSSIGVSNYLITSVWYGLEFIVNKKWKNKIYKLGKVDERIPVLQLLDPGVKNKRKPIYESRKIVFKPGSRLD